MDFGIPSFPLGLSFSRGGYAAPRLEILVLQQQAVKGSSDKMETVPTFWRATEEAAVAP
jgi:hypothetical protein